MADSIAVIGCGIAGASVAYHLSTRTDAEVTVFECGSVAAATTGKSTAIFRLMDDSLLMSMKRDGMELYNEFLASPRGNPAFDLIGRLEVATEAESAQRLRETELATGTYLDGEALSANVLFPELDTDAVSGALYDPNAGYFRPEELAYEFVDRAEEHGTKVETNTAVTDIETDGGGVSAVQTAAERVPVSQVVSAAGPWNLQVGRLVGLELPIKHTLAPIAKFESPSPCVHTLPNLKHNDSGYYLLGNDDGSVLVGHSPGGYADAGTEYDPAAVPDSVADDVLSGMTDHLGELVPSLLNADLVEEWVGVRSLTPDGQPLVGPTWVDGFSVVAFNSQGIQLAPAAGSIVGARFAGTEPPSYAAAVSPSRFDEA